MSNDQDPGCLGAIMQALGLAPEPAAPDAEYRDDEETLPYHLRDDFLSPAELNFYRVLCLAAGDWAVICPKVSLGDLFYAQTGDYATNTTFRNKIDRKHVDFLLCDRHSMRPRVGVELDDASHRRANRRDRDRFIDAVFEAADLPLVRIEVQASYKVQAISAALRNRARVGQEEPGSPAEPETESQVTTTTETRPQADVSNKTDVASLPSSPPLEDTPPACPKCGKPMVLRVVKKEGPHKGKKLWGCRSFPRCRGLREYVPRG